MPIQAQHLARKPRTALGSAVPMAAVTLVLCLAVPAVAAEPPLNRPRQQTVAATGLGPEGQVTQVPQLSGSAAVSVAGRRGGVAVEAGSGRIVTLGSAVNSVFTADPKVVDVRPASPTALFLFGVAPGKTTVAAMGANGNLVAQWDVVVRPSSYGASEASAALGRILPGRGIRVDPRTDGLVVRGSVANGAEAERVMATARGYATPKQTVENRLQVSGPAQVTLKVRVAEMSRTLTRQLGVNWQGLGQIGKYAVGFNLIEPLVNGILTSSTINARYTNRGVDINGVIDALSRDQLIHLLAEPTLTAMSGETASFLVGGEFPIPVASNPSNGINTITVDFKQFGVSLAFVPTVLSDGQINLHVRPEVSELTTEGAVVLNNIQIPAIKVRRAETTVELGSGQSFAIAGLLSDSATMTGNGLPGLGDIPLLGALFRSDGFQRAETELVIVVTPYLTGPVNDARSLLTPTESWREPNDGERIFLLRQTGSIPGSNNAGFVVR